MQGNAIFLDDQPIINDWLPGNNCISRPRQTATSFVPHTSPSLSKMPLYMNLHNPKQYRVSFQAFRPIGTLTWEYKNTGLEEASYAGFEIFQVLAQWQAGYK